MGREVVKYVTRLCATSNSYIFWANGLEWEFTYRVNDCEWGRLSF